MKKIQFLALAAITLALGACSNDEDFAPVASGEIRVDASIGTMTRVATTGNIATFEKNDQISVFAWTGNANEVPANRVVDGSVNTFNGTTWTASPQMLWADMESAHYFLAVYPAHTITDFKADLYELKTDDQMKSDLLIAVNNSGLTAQNNPVQLTFDHAMAKLVVNLHFRDQWATTPTVESVNLEGYTNATVDYLTKTVTAKDKGDISLPALTSAPTGYEKSYSSIVIPSTDTKTIRIHIGDKDYVYNHATNIPLESGKYTTINLNVGRNTITLTDVSISKWEKQGDDIEGEAEEVIQYTTSETGGITTYTVYTAAGLQAVNKLITSDNSLLNSNITLAADIDLPAPAEGGSNWTAIGNNINPYTGTFDGGGHTIRGLVINSTESEQGLIGLLGDDSGNGGSVKNLTIEGCTITGKSNLGGIAGTNRFGTIENCTVKDTPGNPVSIVGNSEVGGIVGYNNYGTVIGCRVLAEGDTVTLEGSAFATRVGGIVGVNREGTISACFAKKVDVTASNEYGGIVGHILVTGDVIGCYAYKCTQSGTALSGDKNVLGYGRPVQCYYTTADETPTFSGYTGSNATTWGNNGTAGTAVKLMNDAITAASYTWQWGGTADNPTLTKK